MGASTPVLIRDEHGRPALVSTDQDGRQIIITNKQTIAESMFKLKGESFSLDEHPPFADIYNVSAKYTVICSGRQVGKSVTARNFQTAECLGSHHWESIAVLPSLMQMRRYSQNIGKIIASPDVKNWWVDNNCRKNVTDRSFVNGSVMYFGATSQLESLRGLSANRILEDEVQDMVSDDLAIVEESLSGQKPDMQFILRTGTAKTKGNVLEETFRRSSQCEWIVICPSGHHNLPAIENIQLKGFCCKRCKAVCDVRAGYWRAMAGLDQEWIGFRIPQIIMPGHTEYEEKWAKICWKLHNADNITFLNEVMGQAAGSGISILDEDHLKACCEPEFEPYDYFMPGRDDFLAIYATVDWGLTARRSFTVLAIWGLTRDDRLQAIYIHKFTNPDLFQQIDEIALKIRDFCVTHVGVDWGAGLLQSELLKAKIKMPVHMFMYVSEQHELTHWDPNSRLWKVNRTKAMSETFTKMRTLKYWFPHWSFFKLFADMILCIREEPIEDRNNNDKFKYDHSDDSPDDFAHCAVYANLILTLHRTGKI